MPSYQSLCFLSSSPQPRASSLVTTLNEVLSTADYYSCKEGLLFVSLRPLLFFFFLTVIPLAPFPSGAQFGMLR